MSDGAGHIDPADAAGLAALPPGDPEREAAFRHAAACPGCRDALAKGEKLVAMLDAVPPPAPPTAAALLRVSREILAELAAALRRLAPALLCGALVAWSALVFLAHRRDAAGATWAQSIAVAAVAAAGALLVVRSAGLAAAGAALLSGAYAAFVGAGGTLEPGIGVHCVLAELAAAAVTVAPFVVLARRRRVVVPAAVLMAAAAVGALAGHAALDLTCPVRAFAPHLWAFHVGGVLLAATLGAAAGRLHRTQSPV